MCWMRGWVFVSSAARVLVRLMVIIDVNRAICRFVRVVRFAICGFGCLHLPFVFGCEPSLHIGGFLLFVRSVLEDKWPLSLVLES